MRFYRILPLFCMLYALQTEARSSEILAPESPRTFASKALNPILTTLDQRIEIDANNLKNIKKLLQQRTAKRKTAKLFEYLEISELKVLGESLLNMSLALAAINQENYESTLTHALINQTADFCSGMITDKIRTYVTLAVKLKKAQQESSSEAIETLIKEMYVSHLKECKTTQIASPPYFSIAWDRMFAMAPSSESHLFFDLAVIKEIMNNHVLCTNEHDIVGINLSSMFTYFFDSILTTSERSKPLTKRDSITPLTQERLSIFVRYCEIITKLNSDQACSFLLEIGGVFRGLQEACKDINRRIEDCYTDTA